ncbi:MAG: hypothetical protein KDK26_11600 [Roseivivax sp.]|nr:hypothetical protein [Roseivivax sp.]
MTGRKQGTRIAAVVAMIFGALTILSGGTTIMGALDMGAVVPFVLWFNTAAGVFYVAIGLGLWAGRVWAFPLALGVFAATVLVFSAFGLHVARGGAFEMRTVAAMTLRCVVLAGLALAAWRSPAGS